MIQEPYDPNSVNIINNNIDKLSNSINLKFLLIILIILFLLGVFYYFFIRKQINNINSEFKNKIDEVVTSINSNINKANIDIKNNKNDIKKLSEIENRLDNLDSNEKYSNRLQNIEESNTNLKNYIDEKKNKINNLEKYINDINNLNTEQIKKNKIFNDEILKIKKLNKNTNENTNEKKISNDKVIEIEAKIYNLIKNSEYGGLSENNVKKIKKMEDKMDVFDKHWLKLYGENLDEDILRNKFDLNKDQIRELKTYNDVITDLKRLVLKLKNNAISVNKELSSIRNTIKGTVKDMFTNSFKDIQNKLDTGYFDKIKVDTITFNTLQSSNYKFSIDDINGKKSNY